MLMKILMRKTSKSDGLPNLLTSVDLTLGMDLNNFANTLFIKINQPEYEKNKENLINYKGQLIVTLGEKGVKWNDITYPPSRQAEVSDLSGAGDTFFAGLIYEYLKSKSITKSITFAQDCALKAVEKKGVVVIK